MKSTLVKTGLMALMVAALGACGGGQGGASVKLPDSPANNTGNALAGDPQVASGAVMAAVQAAGLSNGFSNATPSINPKMAFQLVGSSPITINGAPVVNFAVVDASGKHVPNLQLFNASGAAGDPACGGSNVTFAIARFDGHDWQNLISRQRYSSANVPAGKFSVVEGSTDPKPSASIANPATALADPATRVVGILEENASNGFYTYRFATDLSQPLLLADAVDQRSVSLGKLANNGNLALKDGTTVHRLALQLCYVDPVTRVTVKVNPYIDFRLAADGHALPLTNRQGALVDVKKVVERASCNACHSDFAQHGAGRVEPNFCVMCHNPGSTDYNTNNAIDFKLMVHKFHMGQRLKNDYQVVGAIAKKTDPVSHAVSGVIYPQNQKNCVKCHDGSSTAVNPSQDGDNWQKTASKNACFSCHDDYAAPTSNWKAAHQDSWGIAGLNVANPDASRDSACASCHNSAAVGGVYSDGKPHTVNTAAAHAIPQWTLGENFQLNILKVTLNPASATRKRTVTVRYSVSNPKDASEYDLWDNAKYSYSTVSGSSTTRNFFFGGLSMLFGWNTADYTNQGAMGRPWNSSCTTVVAAPAVPTCDAKTGLPSAAALAPTSGNSPLGLVREGGPVSINALADRSVVRVGSSNQFELTSTELPDNAVGSGVVAFQGRITLDQASALKLTPAMPAREASASTFTVPVANTLSYFAISDASVQPRRVVVSADKCNACHGKFLGFSNATTAAPGWGGHGGARNDPQVCVICHNGNALLRDASITGGVTTFGTPAHFKSFIHQVHKEQAGNYPVWVWPSNLSQSTGAMLGQNAGLKNCNMCHEANSYQRDLGVQGTTVIYDVGVRDASSVASSGSQLASIDVTPADNGVISPKASACYSCHSSAGAKDHMIRVGGAQFGSVTQAGLVRAQESCDSCHQSASLVAPVDRAHGQ